MKGKLLKTKFVLSVLIVFMLLFPFSMLNISFNKYLINSQVILDTKMVIVAVILTIYAITYFISKYKGNIDKRISLLFDEISIDTVLIILSSYGYISPIITVVVVLRHIILATLTSDEINDNMNVEMVLLIIGIILKLINNLPMEFIGIALDEFFLIAGTILCFILTMNHILSYKKIINKNDK